KVTAAEAKDFILSGVPVYTLQTVLENGSTAIVPDSTLVINTANFKMGNGVDIDFGSIADGFPGSLKFADENGTPSFNYKSYGNPSNDSIYVGSSGFLSVYNGGTVRL